MTMNGNELSTALYWALVFFFGSLWGSFFYTLALRFTNPAFQGRVFKTLIYPSSCPRCGVKISFMGLVPLLGYLYYRGKCRQCGKIISPLYPFTEFLFGALGCVMAGSRGIAVESLLLFVVLGLAFAVSIIDIKTMLIPNALVLALLALAVARVATGGNIRDHLTGALGMFAFFLLILLLFPGSFGGGDVKYATVIGFLMGPAHSIVVMEVALITGSLTGVAYVLLTRGTFRAKIPFAPFLSAGLFSAVLYGKELILFYNSVVY